MVIGTLVWCPIDDFAYVGKDNGATRNSIRVAPSGEDFMDRRGGLDPDKKMMCVGGAGHKGLYSISFWDSDATFRAAFVDAMAP